MCGRKARFPIFKNALECRPVHRTAEKGLKDLWDQLPHIPNKDTALNLMALIQGHSAG